MSEQDDLRALFGRYPSGVCVVTVDADGQRLGLTIGSLVSLSLDPPLVGFAISREAAMHELLREAGGCAISLLAAGQDWLAQHFARGVPPIAMWHGIATEQGASGAPLLVGALGWLECALARGGRRGHAHVLRLRGRARRARARTRRRSSASRGEYVSRVIDAVVFDLDGVLVDSEHVWDEVREELARERGGRWHERAQADMMGMSSTEWSRYMHDVIGLAEPPEEINAEVVRRMQAALRDGAAAHRRRGRGGAAAGRARSGSGSRRRRTGR